TKANLQRLRSLRDRKHREAQGLFVVEGEKVVSELLAARFPFVEVYATPTWQARHLSEKLSASGTRFEEISDQEMARASHFPTPSTVLAVGRIQRETLEPVILQQGLTLALDS